MLTRLSDRKPTHAETIANDHHDRTIAEIICHIEQGVQNRSDLIFWIMTAPKQDDTWQRRSTASEKLTEVGVSRQDDPTLLDRQRHHLLVSGAQQADISDVDSIVSGVEQTECDHGSQTLIDEKRHAPARNGSSRSRTVAAAYSSAARTSSTISCG